MVSDKMKRNLGDIVHVTRGYGKNHAHSPHKNIHYSGEDYKVEIRKFDRNFDKIYKITDINYTNLSKKSWRNLTALYCDNIKKKPSINFDYDCKETGDYLVDLLYYDYNHNDKKCKGKISLKTNNGDYEAKKLSSSWAGDDNNLNRHTQKFSFKNKNKYNIKYDFNINVAPIGIIIRKFDTYFGTRYNKGDLTIESINGKISDDMSPNEATIEIWYNHELDDNSNISGYLFDYRDEVNIYKKDPTDTDFKQIYGGYISTVNVNENDLTMTINCADRLIDGENRFCLQEMVMLGGENTDDKKIMSYSKDSYSDYNNRGEMLNYLTNCYELPLDNSDILEDSFFKKQFPKGYKFNYTKKSHPEVSSVNMVTTQNKDYLLVRNGNSRYDDFNSYDDKGNKPQTCVILDCTKLDKPIKINNAPNFYIKYGLGEEEHTKTDKNDKKKKATKKAKTNKKSTKKTKNNKKKSTTK